MGLVCQTYLQVFLPMEERHCIWPKVSRDYEFPAWVANGASNRNQTAQKMRKRAKVPKGCTTHFSGH